MEIKIDTPVAKYSYSFFKLDSSERKEILDYIKLTVEHETVFEITSQNGNAILIMSPEMVKQSVFQIID